MVHPVQHAMTVHVVWMCCVQRSNVATPDVHRDILFCGIKPAQRRNRTVSTVVNLSKFVFDWESQQVRAVWFAQVLDVVHDNLAATASRGWCRKSHDVIRFLRIYAVRDACVVRVAIPHAVQVGNTNSWNTKW